MPWTLLRPKTLEDLYAILYDLSDTQAYVFRGHSSFEWPHLEPSLHRQLGTDRTLEQSVFVEANAIRAFRRHGRSLLLPSELTYFDKILDSITLMQHYGAPTRLLDWTLSPWVACYFAVQSPSDEKHDAAIWSFNHRELRQRNAERRERRERRDFDRLTNADSVEAWAMGALARTSYIDIFRYKYANPQMSAQQSLFTISSKLDENHDIALANSLAEPWQTLKIVIPSAQRRKVMQRLFAMNVSGLALFPTLDGVGRSIRETINSGLPQDDEGLLWILEGTARAARRAAKSQAVRGAP
jgi:hypothetical protein